jgi:predicted permease
MKHPSSSRVYRFLMKLFPFDFQREYGGEMEGVFQQQLRDTPPGQLWWRTAIGFVKTAPVEHLDVFRRDVRHGMRSLAQNRMVTLIAITTLALGIGGNTAIFSMVNAMFLRPLPVPDPERVIRVTSGLREGDVKYSEYQQFRDRNDTFVQLAGFQDKEVTFRTNGPPESAVATTVTGNYFHVFEPRILLGRPIGETDDQPGAPAVAMLSEDFWRSRFAADPTAIGQTVTIDGSLFTIVGVTPEWFGGADRDASRDIWLPWNGPQRHQPSRLNMVGRLRPGFSMDRARAELLVIAGQLPPEANQRNQQHLQINTAPARMVAPVLVQAVIPLLAFLTAIVVLTLLIPCLNIGSLFLARSAERRREMGIRIALGAGRRQLMRQLLTESLLVAIAAGAAGLAIFAGTLAVLVSYFGISASFAARMVYDGRVGVFGFGVSLATTLLFGLGPSLGAVRIDVLPALKGGSATSAGRHSRLRAVFITGQVAVCALLLATAGLLIRSLTSSQLTDLGIDTRGVVLGQLNMANAGLAAERTNQFYETLLRQLQAAPDVVSANIAEAGRLSVLSAKARTVNTTADSQSPTLFRVSSGHFSTLGIPLISGRDFTAADREGSVRVGIVNESLARREWPGESALGKHFANVEIVGVVKDAKYLENTNTPARFLYVPLAQDATPLVVLLVKTHGSTANVVQVMRTEIAKIDPDIPLSTAAPLDQLAYMSLLPVRVVMTLAGVLGVLALGLAAMGLYGVVTYLARQRRREIGIRIAVGATPSDVIRAVTGQAMRWTAIGLALGLATAVLAAGLLRGFFYGVSPLDPVALLGVFLVLAAAAVLACWMPAQRATRIDPVAALREE